MACPRPGPLCPRGHETAPLLLGLWDGSRDQQDSRVSAGSGRVHGRHGPWALLGLLCWGRGAVFPTPGRDSPLCAAGWKVGGLGHHPGGSGGTNRGTNGLSPNSSFLTNTPHRDLSVSERSGFSGSWRRERREEAEKLPSWLGSFMRGSVPAASPGDLCFLPSSPGLSFPTQTAQALESATALCPWVPAALKSRAGVVTFCGSHFSLLHELPLPLGIWAFEEKKPHPDPKCMTVVQALGGEPRPSCPWPDPAPLSGTCRQEGAAWHQRGHWPPGDPLGTSQEPGKLTFRSLGLSTDHMQDTETERQAPPTPRRLESILMILPSHGPRVQREHGHRSRKPESDAVRALRGTQLQREMLSSEIRVPRPEAKGGEALGFQWDQAMARPCPACPSGTRVTKSHSLAQPVRRVMGAGSPPARRRTQPASGGGHMPGRGTGASPAALGKNGPLVAGESTPDLAASRKPGTPVQGQVSSRPKKICSVAGTVLRPRDWAGAPQRLPAGTDGSSWGGKVTPPCLALPAA